MTLQKLSFPRQHARTQRFTLGAPRAFTVSPDGERVIFLRSASGTDRSNKLWVLDLAADGTPKERVVADPGTLLGGSAEKLSAQERARRERSREGSSGIVGYAVDSAAELAAFALSGKVYVAELRAGSTRALPVPGPVLDPRPSPDGRHVAYVSKGALRVVAAEGDGDRALAEPEDAHISYGLAEFIAAEEMQRSRGFWWSPESDRLLVARVDDSAVKRWWIADPAHPDRKPAEVAYPAAGTPNADVRLLVLGLDGTRTEVVWDRSRYPYLAQVHWSSQGAPLILVQARDQRSQLFLAVDPESGTTRTVHVDEDPVWLDLFAGVPAWAPDGRLVRIVDEGGARVLSVGDRPLTGAQLQILAVLDIGESDVLVAASAGEEAAEPEIGESHVYRVNELGVERVSEGAGVHSAVRAGGVTVLISTSLERPGAAVRVLRDGKQIATVATYAEEPVLSPRVQLTEGGAHRIPCAVLLPTDYQESDGPLPVLMDPYGGPHGRRVVAAHNPHLTSQWFADQGFAVVVADGRGSPGRSPAWEKAIKNNLVLTLDDQVEAVHALAERFPLDLTKVAIRGWSYGGYLAGMAVLRRPDVFHAAVVGAPVTDQRLYDTHYTERYLGDPTTQPEVYAYNSLLTDEGLSEAADQVRPMMIVHGLADDNVVVAHSLRLSSALLSAGRPHEVLPLSGVTHMTPQEQVAENLLLLQVDFLKRSLGLSE
ncbi:prolyl oligopeptidase family serine peptidase [Streptomyces sp. NBC_01762]|uniref:S9 family peptidase n=1 Tax=unclassified Streptomyces TaxID=2593676 RepID=UPI002DD9E4B0|nr:MULTISPECIES: prolyl oligopeptidase family serine peptidase [unclassified Streptomyces]WSC39024.1 prolyl oligopeptidase family serine peptidase [Streptomyces sp. NBC_01763]WSC47167.1 prolyl oligopeptidase family serine peptidase [Streptomyces sp. NBC_01762]WSD26822.1 prolyl oligopeptidase family serine peptidase [Streptomyces sp. NBC_01751]WSJ51253.1 prolyl oligopeptidase family serine peptidase [Streptomyces sp. NBC_01318]